MRKTTLFTLAAATLATTLAPAVASAQGQRELLHDAREIRKDRREIRHDMARRDHPEARQDRRQINE